MDIKYKFASLLTEGYNFTNADEVMSAIKTNQVGVKILRFFKDEKQDHVPIKLAFKKFFERCESLGIKDTTYGVQLLCSKCETLQDLKNAINDDGLYEFLKSYKKPWVKQLPEYKEVLANLYNSTLWHNLEKAIQEEQVKHGKVSKGSGELKDVKIPYDDGTWKLMIPSSFEGEKAAAYYIKDGKETPTNWCTRANEHYYKEYTKDAPLYIIRNMKTGKSYQMAFTIESGPGWDDEDYENITVHFLDQNDENGDEITNGDLSKIPNELLKHIPIPGKNKTMANYNTDKAEPSPHAGEKGYIKTDQETWGKEQIVDKKYQREVCKFLDKNFHGDHYYDRFGERDIVKIVSNKSYFEGSRDKINNKYKLSQYANTGKKIEDNYKLKAKKIRYYFLGHPDSYVEIIASKKAGTGPVVNKATEQGNERYVLQYTAFYELGASIPKEIGNSGSFTYITKNQEADAETYDKLQKKENYFENKIKDFMKNKFKSLGFTLAEYFDNILNRKVSKRVKEIKKFKIGPDFTNTSTSAPGKIWTVTLMKEKAIFSVTVFFEKLPIKKENMNVRVLENYEKEIEPSPQFVDTCFEISKFIFDVWRKNFHDEIVQYRSEGLNKSNIYEEINYFDY